MAKREYHPTNPDSMTQKRAEIIGKELHRLFPDDQFKPRTVVQAARNPSSPLHGYFEWNDKKAGEKYRLHQAIALKNSIRVVIRDGGPKMPAYHYVRVAGGQREHIGLEQCLSSNDLWTQVVDQAAKQMELWLLKYETYVGEANTSLAKTLTQNVRSYAHEKAKATVKKQQDQIRPRGQ